MNKIMIVNILILMCFFNLRSQENLLDTTKMVQLPLDKKIKVDYKNYLIGVYGGIAFSSILGANNNSKIKFSNNYYTNYNIGVSVEFNRLKRVVPFSIETGLFYIKKGTLVSDYVQLDKNGQNLADPIDIKNIFNYLQLPININYDIINVKRANIKFLGGAFVSYLISNDIKYLDYEVKFENEINSKVDFGLNIGISFEYIIRNNKLIGLEYTYQYGFISPIDKNYSNSTHLINLFYKFY